MVITSAHELFVHELQDMYSGEQQLLKALPKMIKKAHHADLQDALEGHLEETHEHVDRLKEVFELLDLPAKDDTCEAIRGIIQEAEDGIGMAEGPVMDLVIIGAAQKVEHYEKAAYKTLFNLAEGMGHTQEADLLKETLEEERMASQKLLALAKTVMPTVPTGMEKID